MSEKNEKKNLPKENEQEKIQAAPASPEAPKAPEVPATPEEDLDLLKAPLPDVPPMDGILEEDSKDGSLEEDAEIESEEELVFDKPLSKNEREHYILVVKSQAETIRALRKQITVLLSEKGQE